ncbi:nuclear transport factor 2 family protein [Sphingopyxis kveilinensis]|uniref:nuclear transport factor 2 family protein n=1 Tax=Sphingopyxis kveilinensis TaxID=3114367 RepID=UPI0030D1E9DB
MTAPLNAPKTHLCADRIRYSRGWGQGLFLALGALALPVAAAGTSPTAPEHLPPTTECAAEAARVVEDYVEAQNRLDTSRMARLMDPDYVEISPLGALDDRSAVLGFYSDPNASRQDIALEVDTQRALDAGCTIIASLVLKGATGERRLRVTYTLRRAAGTWRIAVVQYTAVRPK